MYLKKLLSFIGKYFIRYVFSFYSAYASSKRESSKYCNPQKQPPLGIQFKSLPDRNFSNYPETNKGQQDLSEVI